MSVDVGTSEIDNSRVDFYLILPITFKPAFSGAQGIHMLVDDFSGRTSGWQQLGTWTPGSGTMPDFTISVAPASRV